MSWRRHWQVSRGRKFSRKHCGGSWPPCHQVGTQIVGRAGTGFSGSHGIDPHLPVDRTSFFGGTSLPVKVSRHRTENTSLGVDALANLNRDCQRRRDSVTRAMRRQTAVVFNASRQRAELRDFGAWVNFASAATTMANRRARSCPPLPVTIGRLEAVGCALLALPNAQQLPEGCRADSRVPVAPRTSSLASSSVACVADLRPCVEAHRHWPPHY